MKNGTLERAACAIGLVLVALCALTSQARAMPGPWPRVSATTTEMRSGGGQTAANGGPLGSARHDGDSQTGQRVALRPGETFDWADASVGAGVTAMLGLIGLGGALRLNRRRVHGEMTA